MTQFFITTAIDYVNSLPHIGTAYEKIGADVLARFHRMLGDNVVFQMGNDEHSVNVKKSAEKKNLSPKNYCDEMRPQFEAIWKKLSITYDQFIQTSELKHHEAVKKFIGLLDQNGDIFEGDYEGLYCESCEAYYTEKDLVDGVCPQHKTQPKFIKEKNFFFKLTKYGDILLNHIEKNPDFILPSSRRNEIINVIKSGLKDISISRAGFDWGIPFPKKPNHVVYVWFDALINYLSLIGFTENSEHFKATWPASLHVIGKDITRFHCVIWPAMLLSAKLPLPKTVFGHGFVYLKGEKMSKSLGNVVTPLDVADKYGPDALRYYLMRTASFGDDSNFTWDDFILRYNSDLANGLGNAISRTAGMIERYFGGSLSPSISKENEEEINLKLNTYISEIKDLLNPVKSGDIHFHRALEKIWSWLSEVDRFIDNQAPWTLAKEKKMDQLATVLTLVVSQLFCITLLIKPFLPETSEKIWAIFGWDKITPFQTSNFKTSWVNAPLKVTKQNLFPKIETKIT